MSRIRYAIPAWRGLTQASDILKIDKLQRKLKRIEYASHDHPTIESKVHKAEEKLFRKVTVEEGHVLRQYLPQNNAIADDAKIAILHCDIMSFQSILQKMFHLHKLHNYLVKIILMHLIKVLKEFIYEMNHLDQQFSTFSGSRTI